jgi:hypothetical protein
MINGQVNLRDAVARKVDFEAGGKSYKLTENPAVLIVRYGLLVIQSTDAKVNPSSDLEDGTLTNPVLLSTMPLSLALSSILLSISIITPKNLSTVGQDPIFICQKWSIISKHVFGMIFSTSLSRTSACSLATSVRRF